MDFYKFSIENGTTVKMTVSRETLEGYNLSVWNADLVKVGSSALNRKQTYVWEKYLAPGTYYIKISDGDNTGTYTLKWESINYVEAVQLKKSELVLERKKSYSLLQSVLPENANNKNIQWTSDDTSVASVDSYGKVTARGIGTATIEAAAMDGS